MQLFDWNIAAGSNNSAPPNGAPENMEYSEVNDTMREMMAVLARYFQSSVSGTKVTTGTQPAYVLTTDYSLDDYAEGQIFAFTAHATSTGAVTLNVDGEGAGNVVDARGQQLGSGDIRNGGFYVVRRTSGGTFMVLGALAGVSIAAAAAVTLNQAYSAGGTGDAITITTGILTAYANGQMIAFRATANNTGAVTINIDGLGAEALEDYRSAALSADDIQNGRGYIAIRTGGEWRIVCGLPIDLANDVIGALPIANGGTGAATASAAVSALIAGTSTVTAAPGDSILIGDASDSGNGKDALVSTVGTGKQSIWVPASAMQPQSGSVPAAGTISIGGAGDLPYLGFDAGSIERATFCVPMPKGWNVSTLTAKIFWAHPSTTTNFSVVWAVQAGSFGDDDSLNVDVFAGASVTDVGGTTADLYVSAETGAINPGNTEAAEDLLVCRVLRQATDGSDTLAVDAQLIGVMLYYTTSANTDD